jgi:hypothetical protein
MEQHVLGCRWKNALLIDTDIFYVIRDFEITNATDPP